MGEQKQGSSAGTGATSQKTDHCDDGDPTKENCDARVTGEVTIPRGDLPLVGIGECVHPKSGQEGFHGKPGAPDALEGRVCAVRMLTPSPENQQWYVPIKAQPKWWSGLPMP